GAAAAAGIAAAKHRTGDDEDRTPTTTTETEYVVTDVEVVPDPAATTYPGGPVSEPNRPL
ncbi:hypothetical protein, partial [Micromonospora sp. 4G55]|uniref:hypothetical protein n=1 Tax=Micromonospora sp. 4G55 TaxID=2806102 RepID=UPI001A581A00